MKSVDLRQLKKKLPKLLACQVQGDVTALILELSDVALTNHVFVAQALEAALADRTDWPDHVFIADTACEGSWHLFRPVIDGIVQRDLPYIDIPPELSGGSDL